MRSSQVVNSTEVLQKVSQLFAKTNETLKQFTDLQKNVYLQVGMLIEGTKSAAEYMSSGAGNPSYLNNLNEKMESLRKLGTSIKASEKDIISKVDALKTELKNITPLSEKDKDAQRVNNIINEIKKTIQLLDETNAKMSADIAKNAEPFRNLIKKINEIKTSHTLFSKP